MPWLAGALKTASLELRKVESDLAAPDSAPNWMCKDDYNKNATAAATASARMMLINIILTVPVLAIRSTDCITPCLQALFYSSFVYSLSMRGRHIIKARSSQPIKSIHVFGAQNCSILGVGCFGVVFSARVRKVDGANARTRQAGQQRDSENLALKIVLASDRPTATVR